MDLKKLISRVEDRREPRNPDADDREVGARGPISRGKGVRVGSADPLRPGRGAPAAGSSEIGSPATDAPREAMSRTPSRRNARLVGFEYDPSTQTARFSMYLPGTAGRERKRATVHAESYDKAVELWSACRYVELPQPSHDREAPAAPRTGSSVLARARARGLGMNLLDILFARQRSTSYQRAIQNTRNGAAADAEDAEYARIARALGNANGFLFGTRGEDRSAVHVDPDTALGSSLVIACCASSVSTRCCRRGRSSARFSPPPPAIPDIL